MQIPYNSITLEIVQGDIVRETTDAIVNAANSALAGGGGVDGAIHRAAGSSVMDETRRRYPRGCPTGEAVVTAAGRLRVKYIVHTVAPRYNPNDDGRCAAQLYNAYRNSLDAAYRHECHSVSFPSLGTGVYHYPLSKAASIAIKATLDFEKSLPRKTEFLVRFVLFDRKTYDAFRDALVAGVPLPWTMDELDVHGATDYQTVEEVERYDARMRLLRDVDRENRTLLALAAPGPNANVLEIGTGTGAFARAAAKQCRKVVAVDLSKTMLEYAAIKAKEESLHNIKFEHAGFLTFDTTRTEKYDVALSSLALHHLPDTWKAEALARIRKCMKPGGLFILVDVVWQTEGGDFDDYFSRLLENDFAAPMLPAIYAHAKREYSTFDWIMKGMLERADFTLLKDEPFGSLATLYVARAGK